MYLIENEIFKKIYLFGNKKQKKEQEIFFTDAYKLEFRTLQKSEIFGMSKTRRKEFQSAFENL